MANHRNLSSVWALNQMSGNWYKGWKRRAPITRLSDPHWTQCSWSRSVEFARAKWSIVMKVVKWSRWRASGMASKGPILRLTWKSSVNGWMVNRFNQLHTCHEKKKILVTFHHQQIRLFKCTYFKTVSKLIRSSTKTPQKLFNKYGIINVKLILKWIDFIW